MRIRLLLAGGGLVLLTLLGSPGAARAQEPPPPPPEGGEQPKIEPEAQECIHLLEQGGNKPEDCHEAPSLILPETSEIFWGALSFTGLLVALRLFAWPGLKKGMEARSERIRKDLEAAEEAKTEAQKVLDDYKRQLDEAKDEAGRIIEEARQSADSMRRDLQSRAESDIAEMRERAAADVEAAKEQAIADLRDEVANLAIGAAEVVVEHSLDRDTQIQLIENYINRVGASRNGDES